MKRIIDNKRYDTETATQIGYYDNGENGINEVVERLYRTKSGAYFLHGEGGPNTGYAENTGNNSRSGSSAIVPMGEDEAYEWLEGHNLTDAIEEYFSDRFQDA